MSQQRRLLDLLRERREAGVTPLDALDLLGSFRLGARIFELRAQGYDIRSETYTTPNGAHVARYVLRERPVQLEAWSV